MVQNKHAPETAVIPAGSIYLFSPLAAVEKKT
jgi:hypothetical protein